MEKLKPQVFNLHLRTLLGQTTFNHDWLLVTCSFRIITDIERKCLSAARWASLSWKRCTVRASGARVLGLTPLLLKELGTYASAS